jgi:hypothetical protein
MGAPAELNARAAVVHCALMGMAICLAVQKAGSAYMHWLMVAGHGSADLIEGAEAAAAVLIAAACVLHVSVRRALSPCGRLMVASLLSCGSSVLFGASFLWHAGVPDAVEAPLWWLWLRPEIVGLCASALSTLIFLASRTAQSLRPWVFPWDAAATLAPVSPTAHRGAILYPVESRAYDMSSRGVPMASCDVPMASRGVPMASRDVPRGVVYVTRDLRPVYGAPPAYSTTDFVKA